MYIQKEVSSQGQLYLSVNVEASMIETVQMKWLLSL